MLAIRLGKLLKEQEEQIKNRDESLEKAREEIKWLRGMLKEQEAKPMIENERGWNCPSCGITLIVKTASGYPCDLIDLPENKPIHFCPRCGQEVKWNE